MARGKWRGGQKTRVRGVMSLGGGSYRLRVYGTDPVSGRKLERDKIVTAASVAEAKEIRGRFEAELRGTRPVLVPVPLKSSRPSRTVGDLAKSWLEKTLDRRRKDGTPRVTPATKARYLYSVEKIILPSIGKREIQALTKEWVETWRDWLAEKYATTTVNAWLTILRMILRDAGIDIANRVSGLQVDDTRTTEDAPNLLEDEEQVGKMLEVVREKEPEHLALISVLVTTGLRTSTALALRREDFEPERNVIVARRRLSAGELVEGVKRSRAARDVVPLVDWVWEAVQAEWRQHNAAQLKSGLAFPSREGGHRARTVLVKPLKVVNAALGVARLTPHGLRRTAALLYRLRRGSAVSKAIAGHLTEEMHLHYAPVLSRERAEAGQAVFGGIGPTSTLRTGDAGQAQNGDEAGTQRGRGSDQAPAEPTDSAKPLKL